MLGVCERTHYPRYRTPICYRTTIYNRSTIRADPTPDMDTRNSFSRLKKKVKRLGSKLKPGRTGADIDEENTNPTNPPPQPGLHVVADDEDGSETDADGQQAGSTDQPPQPDEPEPVPANGDENDQGGGEADVDGRKVGPMDLRSHPDVEVGAGSQPGQEGNGGEVEGGGQIHSHSPTPSIPHTGEPDGALMWLFKFLPS